MHTHRLFRRETKKVAMYVNQIIEVENVLDIYTQSPLGLPIKATTHPSYSIYFLLTRLLNRTQKHQQRRMNCFFL